MTIFKFSHYQEADVEDFTKRWPNFSPREMASKREGALVVHGPSMDCLQALRDELGINMNVTSAYRSPAHNTAVGGASRSMHLQARAFDISMANHDPEAFEAAARRHGFNGIGHYPKHNFMHIDTRTKPAKWNKGGWFKTGASDLPSEQPVSIFSVQEKVVAAGTTAVAAKSLAAELGLDLSSVDWQTIGIWAGVLLLLYIGYKMWGNRGVDL